VGVAEGLGVAVVVSVAVGVGGIGDGEGVCVTVGVGETKVAVTDGIGLGVADAVSASDGVRFPVTTGSTNVGTGERHATTNKTANTTRITLGIVQKV